MSDNQGGQPTENTKDIELRGSVSDQNKPQEEHKVHPNQNAPFNATVGGQQHQQLIPVLGPDGRPQIGPDGRPIMRPGQFQGPGMIHPGGFGGPGGPGGFQGGPGGFSGPGGFQGNPGGFQGNPGGFQGNPGGFQGNAGGFQGNPGMNQRGPGQGMANPGGIPQSGRFAPTNVSAGTDQQGTYAQTQECWGNCCGFISTYICPCCCTAPYSLVPQGYTGIVQRFGKFYKLVAPGMHYLNPDLDTLVLVDKRERVQNLHRQKVVTRDNISTTIDAVLYFQIADSYKSKFAVTNIEAALVDLVQTTLRNVIGRMTLQDVLEKREELAEKLMEHVTAPAFDWGAKVTRVLIQDIFLPEDQKANMSQGAISKKIAEAKVIQSQADVEAARLMREAAQILSTDAAMQIRYVESLETLSRTGNPKMVFFPADYREIGSMNEHLKDI